MMKIRPTTTFKYMIILAILFSALIGLRWAWSELFHTEDLPHTVVDGQLDMRGIDLSDSPAFFLNGEWEFYPHQLLSHEDFASGNEEHSSVMVQVPGDWKDALGADSGTSYGYGTYRLRVLIDPLNRPITMWLKNVQAASEVEINGFSEGPIGTVATSKNDYEPRSISYTASYYTTGATELNILIRIANYDEPFNGGITRSIRFGSAAAVDMIRWYSIGFQLVTFVVLVLYGTLGFILYAFNRKERTLLSLGMLTMTVAIAITTGQDNLMLLWLPIDYALGFKLRIISLLWQNVFILLVFRRYVPAPAGRSLLRGYVALLAAVTCVLLAGPASWTYGFHDLYGFMGLYLFSFFWFLFTTGKLLFQKGGDRDVVFLLLTAAGITSNLTWSIMESNYDVTTVYYPLDILATMIGFSAYWFKKYFRHARNNAMLNEQFRIADKLKDQFLANTSHELRTPLHGIINIAETVVAKEREKLDENSLRDMELLVTISKRMSHTLGDLLDVVRLQEHRIMLQQRAVPIQSIAPGVVGMLRYLTRGRPVTITIDMPESLPPAWADEQRLVQVLYNLLHNALKYTESGTISLSAKHRGGKIVIAVADTGVGMDEDTVSRIFLPYEQGTYGRQDGRGIGLGLSICKQLVELHGGELTVRSVLGQGSVFSFALKTAQGDFSHIPEAAASLERDRITAPPPKESIDLLRPDPGSAETPSDFPPLLSDGTIRIIAVDDDPVNLSVLAGILSTEPYTITTASSAGEALEHIRTAPWDLLIADVMMPVMSGYELAQAVREHYSLSELPILLLTASSQPADIYAGFLAGANDYVTKPVDGMELKYRIRTLIEQKRSVNERLRIEAAYLQAQIHPHFLLNALNSIMALGAIDTDKMQELGSMFASYLRISYNFINTNELVHLTHELELVQAYLYIEKVRFGDRLIVEWEVDESIHLSIPPLSIQPLIENAVKHGIMSQDSGGTLRLYIESTEAGAWIEVQDDGKGMEQEPAFRLLNKGMNRQGGIGLANTNRRLLQLYGRGLSISSQPGKGTTVSFFVPFAER
ncbi:hybrid sensor histidine kinase/response regulator [Paenibacillus agaridevorans]|uniref:hybrid sensor histidine kinase/response regulator n=1 Tax=Paenibacillus agaridevorans TaxID=171404 RepID=UPI001BE4BA80|nr:ATP-binding protein [Paenibacillus agaridevorans]